VKEIIASCFTDATKSVSIEIKHDDKLPPEENVYLQVALLYTSCSGQRRLRVLNLALRVTTTIAEVFKSCDLDAMMLFFAKQACFKLMEHSPKQVKDNLIHRSAQILACYRKHCTSPTSAGQLILPECLKLLPLYASCLLKNDAISGGSDMTLDDRSYVIQFILSMDLNQSVSYLYPRFIPIHNVVPEETDLPTPVRCTHEKTQEDGAYILENGVHLFVWLGQSLSPNMEGYIIENSRMVGGKLIDHRAKIDEIERFTGLQFNKVLQPVVQFDKNSFKVDTRAWAGRFEEISEPLVTLPANKEIKEF